MGDYTLTFEHRLACLNVIPHLHMVCKALGLKYSGRSRAMLVHSIQDAFVEDPAAVMEVVSTVQRQTFPRLPPAAVTTAPKPAPAYAAAAAAPSASSRAPALHQAAHAHAHIRPAGQAAVRPAAAPAPVHHSSAPGASEAMPSVSNAELIMRYRENPLIHHCDHVGAGWVTKNEARLPLLLSEPNRALLTRRQRHLLVRFAMVEDGKLVLPTKWPAARMFVNKHLVFDTMLSAPNLFLNSLEGPMPCVDVTETALRGAPASLEAGVNVTVTFSAMPAKTSNRRWMLVGTLVSYKDSDDVTRTVEAGSPSMADCDERVLDLMTSDEITVESVSVSLKDPLLMTRITRAVRGASCMHLQCFDLHTFVAMQRDAREARWNCPVCGEKVTLAGDDCTPRRIIFDAWFQSILDSVANSPLAIKAEVRPDGLWFVQYDIDDDDNSHVLPAAPVAKAPRIDHASGSQVPHAAKPKPKRNLGTVDAPIELLDSDDDLF